LDEENKDLRSKLELATKTMGEMKTKLDDILQKNEDLTKSIIEKNKKEADEMLEKIKNAKLDSKQNYWTLAI